MLQSKEVAWRPHFFVISLCAYTLSSRHSFSEEINIEASTSSVSGVVSVEQEIPVSSRINSG